MRGKKGLLGIDELFAIFIIVLALFIFYLITNISGEQQLKLQAAGKVSTSSVSMNSYLRTNVSVGSSLTMADLIIAYYEVDSTQKSLLLPLYTDKENVRIRIKTETDENFKTLFGNDVCYKLMMNNIIVENDVKDCIKLCNAGIQIIDERVYLPHPNGKEMITVYFEKPGFFSGCADD